MKTLDSGDFVRMFDTIAAALAADRDRLCELDSAIGDGDHGISMQLGFETAAKALSDAGATQLEPKEVFTLAAKSFLNAVGASCGPLYATAFLRAAVVVAGAAQIPEDRVADIIAAIELGIAERGKAEPGDKTMLDVWHPVADEMLRSRTDGLDLAAQLQRSVAVARTAETATALLIARKGRASRLGERSVGNVDPGASSARVIIEAIASSLG